MIDPNTLTKLYYTIGEVAKMFDVNASLIRFWEKEFTALKLKKNKKGNRLFTPKDILTLEKIYQLVKVKGMTLEGAKKALKSKEEITQEPEEIASNKEIIERLTGIRERLLRLKD
jgi:DNA-binding transcriptional MerR regulator